jgi:hypothetical protein
MNGYTGYPVIKPPLCLLESDHRAPPGTGLYIAIWLQFLLIIGGSGEIRKYLKLGNVKKVDYLSRSCL